MVVELPLAALWLSHSPWLSGFLTRLSDVKYRPKEAVGEIATGFTADFEQIDCHLEIDS